MAESNEYYSLTRIHKYKAVYNVIIGQRSNGKTYAWKELCIDNYLKNGTKGAYIRRFDEEIKPKNLGQLFDVHEIYERSDHKWNAFTYKSGSFYMCNKDEGSVLNCDTEPFCNCYALNTWETSKGADKGIVSTICFDEFMTRKAYLPNEFVLFQQILSSIIRDRDMATIYMLANTVNKFCPYFKEMGLSHVAEMKQGDIEIYKFGENNVLTVAVEYCSEAKNTKKVKKYYAFDNPQLEMITSGSWEIALYPHAPIPYSKYDMVCRFYIKFDKKIACGDVIKNNKYLYIFYHMHNGHNEPSENDIVYLEEHDGLLNHAVLINEIRNEKQKLIVELMKCKREFYATNEVGEFIRNWKLNVTRSMVK